MNNELQHHGIEGMRWGVRRFQNEDGSYTSAGRARYGIGSNGKMSDNGRKNHIKDNYKKEHQGLSDNQKKALKIGATVVGTAAVAAGTYYVAKKLNLKVTSEAARKLSIAGEIACEKIIKEATAKSDDLFDKALDAMDSGNREEYKLLKKLSSNALIDGNTKAKFINDINKKDIDDVSKSFRKAYKITYGKDKHKIPDYLSRVSI